MNTVHVHASKDYDIYIGSGILDQLGDEIKKLGKVEKVCVVSDANVFPFWGEKVCRILQSSGFEVSTYVFPAGEANKNGITFLDLLNTLAEAKLTRSDLIIALGGGVVGDLAGFAAASYLRGIRFIQIPTTLLAAVDSSVGGKTAIDLPAGKNLAGAFYQPSLVICDTELLTTLPAETFRDGCAEVIKYAVLYAPELFDYLQKTGLAFDRQAVITRCVELKRDVVAEDEFDTGLRMKLNLGHTIGHGVEAKSEFTISHGKAVAIGLAIISRSAVSMGLCSRECCDRILSVLSQFDLPVTTEYTASELFSYALSDKKRSGRRVNLIVPRNIGCCDILPVPVDNLETIIQAGL